MSITHTLVQAAAKDQQSRQGLTGRGFGATITGVQPTTEFMDVEHAYGKHTLRVLHPFVGSVSHHRVGPEIGQRVMMTTRMDTREPSATSYLSADARDRTPENRLAAYQQNKDLYRPMGISEQEIMSGGVAHTFWGRRGVQDQRGGYVRSWLDQDALEAGARSVTHVRELHLNVPQKIGDEERFGGVMRPDQSSKVFRKIIEAPAGTPSLPNVPVNASALSDPIGTITSAVNSLEDVEPAKEFLYVLQTSDGPVVDHREGHVMDDEGQAVQGKLGGNLRLHKKIFGAATGGAVSGLSDLASQSGTGSETWEEQVNDNGDWYVGLPQTASKGIKFETPGGKFLVKSGTASSSMELDGTAGTMTLKASDSGVVKAESGLKLHSSAVKIGNTELAINKVYKTVTKRAGETTVHTGFGSMGTVDGTLNTVSGLATTALAAVHTAVMAAPLTPGVLVGLLGIAHGAIPIIFHTAQTALKTAKAALSPAYMGTFDAHESQTVSVSD